MGVKISPAVATEVSTGDHPSTHQPQLKEVGWRKGLCISWSTFAAHNLLSINACPFSFRSYVSGSAMSLWKIIGVVEHTDVMLSESWALKHTPAPCLIERKNLSGPIILRARGAVQ